MDHLQLATQLEAAIPTVPEGAQAALGGSIGQIVSKSLELVAALKAGNWALALRLARDLLNLIVGEDDGLQFQQAALGDRFKGVLADVLKKVIEEALRRLIEGVAA